MTYTNAVKLQRNWEWKFKVHPKTVLQYFYTVLTDEATKQTEKSAEYISQTSWCPRLGVH